MRPRFPAKCARVLRMAGGVRDVGRKQPAQNIRNWIPVFSAKNVAERIRSDTPLQCGFKCRGARRGSLQHGDAGTVVGKGRDDGHGGGAGAYDHNLRQKSARERDGSISCGNEIAWQERHGRRRATVQKHLLAPQRRAGARPELRVQRDASEFLEPRKLGVVWRVVAEVSAAHVQNAAPQPALIFPAIFLGGGHDEVPSARGRIPVGSSDAYAESDAVLEMVVRHGFLKIVHYA